MNWPLTISLAATSLALAYLCYEARNYLNYRRQRVETGATIGWSPAQEQADTTGNELTPTGQLEREPAATLDDGTVIGRRGLPSWEALSTDTHHAVDARFAVMLAHFGGAIEESAAQFDARMAAIEADFHARRDDMAKVEAEHAALIARLDAERDRLMVSAS